MKKKTLLSAASTRTSAVVRLLLTCLWLPCRHTIICLERCASDAVPAVLAHHLLRAMGTPPLPWEPL